MNELVVEKKIAAKGDFEISFGSDNDCDYAFPDLKEQLSAQHAAIKRKDDRLFIRDLNSIQGVFVNQKRIGANWHEITLNSDVRLGQIEIEIRPRLLLGRDRCDMAASDLYYTISERRKNWFLSKKRVLVDHISITVEPKTMTGVMGPSGAGKTVLLNLLSGHLKPQKGAVMVGAHNVHQSFGLIKDIIGYVPQDDTLIPQLTVRQSLNYCLRLRYPDMRKGIREEAITEVLSRMGFEAAKLKKLLNTKNGSPEQRGLSGGERKRVNIAHELVRNPLILLLDEPTSGLSSVDSEHVIELLHDICHQKQVAILTTIHQPSEIIFNYFDNLVLLNNGGKLAYYGPTDGVVTYFSQYSGQKPGKNPAEYILRVLDKWDYERSPEELFANHENN